MSLNTFSDPTVANDPIPGNPIPVSQIAQPFAHELASVATGGKFSFDQSMNPLDLFHAFHPSSKAGVAVMIMNSLTTPLTLVESSQEALDDWDNGPQVGYPAVFDSSSGTSKTVKAHQIPGVRQYPRPSLHKAPDGSPALVGGIGLYRFEGSSKTTISVARRGLAFACVDNATQTSTPLLGVAFDFRNDRQGDELLPDVTTDLSKQGKKTTQDNLSSLMASAFAKKPYDIGTGTNTMTIWGVVAPGTPAYEPNMVTMVVWVRDISSTFG